MTDTCKILAALETLAYTSEQYYKCVNSLDIRVEDINLRSAISQAKYVIREVREDKD
jgi:hypothetical protein